MIYVVQENYGYGWADLTYEETREEAENVLKDYEDNENCPHRIVKRKER